MRVLITGNMGYVGPVLVRYLRRADPTIELIGFDTGFFAHCLTGAESLPETELATQRLGDIRDISIDLLQGVDAIVHLAAVSNDPMGMEFEKVTGEINQHASVRLAKMAAQAGVRTFVFASSCSVYGQAEGGPRKETDPTNPLTAYARSKIGTETNLSSADLGDMTFTSLRFATACGMSDRLRLDLVLNDLVASAVSTGNISVLSDGSSWRPLIDVEDMARVILWAIRRQASGGGAFLAVNAGGDENNFQVKDLAEAVASNFPGTTVSVNRRAPPDKRSYKVDFSLLGSLAPDHLPCISLATSILRVREGLERMKFVDKNFRQSSYVRLNTLRQHIKAGRLGNDLRWKAIRAYEIP